MAGDGTTFDIALSASGAAGVDAAASSLSTLADRLTAAGVASTAAADAVRTGEAAFKQSEGAAAKAAQALEKLGLAAEAQKAKLAGIAAGQDGVVDVASYQRAAAKLAELNARQSEAAAKAASTSAAMNAEAAALDKLKSAASSAADSEAKLSKEHAAVKDASDKATKAAKEGEDAQAKSIGAAGLLEGAFSKLGGPLGAVGQKASGVAGAVMKMGKGLGAAGPYVAAAALALVVATAFVAATLAITHFAVAAADTARTQALLSDGIAGSVEGGRQLDAAFDDLSNKVPLTRDELSGMASELSKTGLKGVELTTALEEAAIKAAKLKFGPNFAKQMLSLDNQSARLKKNITGLFSGLKIESLLEGLAKIVGLFDSSSSSGEAIKTVFESMFQPIVDGLTALLPKVVSTFIQIEIWIMKALIAVLPFKRELQYIGIAFGILAALCVAAIVVVIAIMLALVAVPALLIAAFMWLGDASARLGMALREQLGAGLDWLKGKFDEVIAFLQGLSLAQIGTDLIDGLVNGITTAGPKVLAAITGLAKGAIDGAKKALGIASPSTVFAEIGVNTAKGMEGGVDDGAGDVQGSLEAMVSPPVVGGGNAETGATTKASSGNSGPSVTITVASMQDALTLRELLAELGAIVGVAVPGV